MGLETKGAGGIPEGDERKRPRVDFGDAEAAVSTWVLGAPRAKQARAEPLRATAAGRGLGAGVAFVAVGHAIRFAIAGEIPGQGAGLAGCKARGAYAAFGGRGPTLRPAAPPPHPSLGAAAPRGARACATS